MPGRRRAGSRQVSIPLDSDAMIGDLAVPDGAYAVVVFAHGSGSSRFSSRNRRVAASLEEAGFATLLLDLLTEREEAIDARTHALRFDIPLLGERVVTAVDWLAGQVSTRALRVGLFGASTGAAAALVAAARRSEVVAAVVSRGGRPDLAGEHLAAVRAPTLLVVGGHDQPVIAMNEDAAARMTGQVQLVIVPGATHLFEEPGALERVTELAVEHFRRTLR